jgi:hypothetical protein
MMRREKMVREFTSRMIDLNDEGYFDKDQLIRDLLSWMPEGDVKQFVRAYDFIGFEDLGFVSSMSPEQEEEDYEYYNRLEAERDIYGDNALDEEFA